VHLLDVNALLAHCWPSHVHHAPMHEWMKRHAREGWLSCAITQAAFVRISCQPSFSPHGFDIDEAWETLRANLRHPGHTLAPLDFGFDEVLSLCTGGVVGHRQITDAYLLTTAIRAGARLLTFDSVIGSLLATEAERKAHIHLMRWTGPLTHRAARWPRAAPPPAPPPGSAW
jgi:toxin-antitoxin system PIN domain toxin